MICYTEVLRRADIEEEWRGQSLKTDDICWKESLENFVLTAKVEGQRARGRQRLTFLGWLESPTGIQPLHDCNQSIETSKRYRRHDCRLRQDFGSVHWLIDWMVIQGHPRSLISVPIECPYGHLSPCALDPLSGSKVQSSTCVLFSFC